MMDGKSFVRTPFNYDADRVSLDTGLRCDDISLTKQSFREEVDINTIVRRFGVTGQMPVALRAPTYADYTNVVDFQTAMNAVALANEAFDELPAEVRRKFAHDPSQIVSFCSDPANREEAERLGFVFDKPVLFETEQKSKTSAPDSGNAE